MKIKLRGLAMLALAVALVASACGADDSGAGGECDGPADGFPDLECREVTVGVENAYLPFNYIPAGQTEGTGWDYDAWIDICDRLNCKPIMTEAGWPAVIDQVAAGEIDTAADGISITDERKEIVDYSKAYMTVQQKFIVQKDDERFATAADIINGDALVGTQVGTTNFELAQDLMGGDERIQAFDQFGLAIQALIAGDIDAVIIDDAAGLGYVGENSDLIKTIDDPLQSDPLGFIFPKGSDLIDPVNQAIDAMIADGTMKTLGEKYFTDSFTVTYEDIEDVAG